MTERTSRQIADSIQQPSRDTGAVAGAIEDGARAEARNEKHGEETAEASHCVGVFLVDNAVREPRATFWRRVLP